MTLVLPRKGVVALYRAALYVLTRVDTGQSAPEGVKASDLRDATAECEKRLKGWLER